MDRDFNVIYANESAWSEDASQLSDHLAKCYQAFAHRNDPCGTCPATKMYESPDVRSVACSIGGDGTACGMHQAFPLVSSSGEVESVLVLFKAPPKPAKQMSGERVEAKYESKLGELIGPSAPMREVLDMIRPVADSSATVLIQGESGTGKELVAKTIHQTSYRRDKPFVVVDCGSLPETLLESELFGHVKGFFTGAHATKRGLFEEADGGTIFWTRSPTRLRCFKPSCCVSFKRVRLSRSGGPTDQDRRAGHFGDEQGSVRAGKGQDVSSGSLLSISGLAALFPPLRERREDISLLVEHFVAGSCTRHRQPVRNISPDVMQA